MKKAVRIITVAGLVLLAVLTFVSRSIYNKNLPQVTAAKLDVGLVPLTWETVGALEYPGAATLKAGGTWTVSEVFVKDGDVVRVGDLLCSFDTRVFDMDRQAMELEVLRLQNALAAMDDWRPQSAAERRAKSYQQSETTASLELAEQRLAYALSQAPPGNGLHTDCAGAVYGLAMEPGDTLLFGDALLSILPDELPELEFSLPPKEGEAFGPGVIVQAQVATIRRDNEGKTVFARQAVSGQVFSSVLRGGQWECRARLNAFEGAPVAGQEVPLKVTQPGETQNYMAPLGCLFEWENQKIVYEIARRPGLFGEENYLTAVVVEVLYDNGKHVSLVGDRLHWQMPLAENISQPVIDGDVVWVRD
ncbi:MAG: efflux RND transporter periplasmic adaptor subunit [Oscillospiraceae bacterium]|nr:efflux RND transporter periplasmic adaptor subunit [Oscillospiraceae bacterium]